MRALLVLPAALAALSISCTNRPAGDAAGPADPEAGFGAACEADADCELAAASCCDCPSFALAVAEGFGASCEGATCPPPSDRCAALEAVCTEGACTARCLPIACALQCESGFASDTFGCLLCACAAAPPEPACEVAQDCAQVPADCCGCARGGQDTAVPAGEVEAHLAGLECPADVSCPDVNTCNPDEIAVCAGGACRLAGPDVPGDEGDAGADNEALRCGTPALPPCPDGQVCVLNAPGADAATRAGLGTCGVL